MPKDVSKTSWERDVLRSVDKYSYVSFMPLEVKESISNFKKRKSAGNEHVNIEHCIYASEKIYSMP